MLELTQNEADNLIKMEKFRINDNKYDFPSTGGNLRIQLKSFDNREEFFLDITQSKIK